MINKLDIYIDEPGPLRRHSFSAPARLCLDRLEVATRRLSVRVASLTSLTQSGSDQSGSVLAEEMLRARVCHGCHSPIDEGHQGYPSGAEKCPLDHWEDCAGGIPRDNTDWRPCPCSSASEGSGIGSGNDSDLLERTVAEPEVQGVGLGAAVTEEVLLAESVPAGNEEKSEKIIGLDSSDTDDEENALAKLEDAYALLHEQKIKQDKEKTERVKRERRERIAFLKSENGKLSSAMGGDIGGTKRKVTSKLPQIKPAVTKPLKTKPGHASSNKDVLDKHDVGAGAWGPAFQDHLNRNQLNSAQYTPGEDRIYSGLDINEIRKIPEMRAEVDGLINLIKSKVPSLDCRPSHVPGQKLPPPQHGSEHAEIIEDFVFHRQPDGTLAKVRVVSDLVEATSEPQHKSHVDDLETSSDEDCDMVPKTGYRFRWMRDSDGEKYNVEEKIPEKPSSRKVYQYVRDASGRSYKRLVPVKSKPIAVSSTTTPRYIDHRSTTANLDVRSVESERRPGFISVSTGPTVEEKQGKGNTPDIVQYARDCPVSWTSKVTSEKINLALWSWSYIAHLLASRTGQAPSLGQGELEARMQHFLNVLEIALQPSSSSEFEGHSWRIARLYAEKIQNKVDRGENWIKFDEKYGRDSQPSELMAAREEIGPKLQVRKVKGKEEEKKELPKGPRRLCTTWNTSTVEGKCDWEVQNEGKACDRRHDCTWCKEKGKRSLFHQRTFCRQRLASGEQ